MGFGGFPFSTGNLWCLEHRGEEPGSHQAGLEGLNPFVWRRAMEHLDEAWRVVCTKSSLMSWGEHQALSRFVNRTWTMGLIKASGFLPVERTQPHRSVNSALSFAHSP